MVSFAGFPDEIKCVFDLILPAKQIRIKFVRQDYIRSQQVVPDDMADLGMVAHTLLTDPSLSLRGEKNYDNHHEGRFTQSVSF